MFFLCLIRITFHCQCSDSGWFFWFNRGSGLIYTKNNSKKSCQNPYNRNNIPPDVFINIKILVKIGKILNKNVYLEIQDEPLNISNEKVIELRALSLFRAIQR